MAQNYASRKPGLLTERYAKLMGLGSVPLKSYYPGWGKSFKRTVAEIVATGLRV
jgi:hypothetical protein